MNNKYLVIGAIVALAVAFAMGRYTAPVKVKTETQVVEVDKKTKDTEVDRDKHKETKIVEVNKPDGTKETTTTIVEDTNTNKKEKQTDLLTETEKSSTEITRAGGFLYVQGLAGLDKLSLSGRPIYGASVSKEVLGPISVGAWGLTNSTFGLSLGLRF